MGTYTLWSADTAVLLLDWIHHLWDVVTASPPGLLLCIKVSMSFVSSLCRRYLKVDHGSSLMCAYAQLDVGWSQVHQGSEPLTALFTSSWHTHNGDIV